jgi:nucleotide-binding universal stress UspA family protein
MVIVCGTDLAESGDTAAAAAVFAGEALGDEVELDAVVDRDFDRRTLRHSTPARHAAQAAELELEAELERVPAAGAATTRVVLEGDPAEALLARARARDARLIVLGQNGHHLPSLFYRRNVVDRVVWATDRPVMIVSTGSGEYDEPVTHLAALARWARGEAPLKVAAVLDQQGVDDADDERAAPGVVSFVNSLRRHRACDVTFLGVFAPARELERVPEPLTYGEADPELITFVERRLLHALTDLVEGEGRMRVFGVPLWDRSALASVVDAEARLLDAELVVVPARRHSRWDTLLARAPELELAGLSHAPVACVPVELRL